MGTENIPDRSDNTEILAEHVNLLKRVLCGNLVPRSAAGAAGSLEGSLGTATLQFLKAHIASGYWNVGDTKTHNSYNGQFTAGQGWFPCTGQIINQVNYDAIHGAGSWEAYIISSPLDGKYAPDHRNRYSVGVDTTTQSGASAITPVGNTAHRINLKHSHQMQHNHEWLGMKINPARQTSRAANGDSQFMDGYVVTTTTANGILFGTGAASSLNGVSGVLSYQRQWYTDNPLMISGSGDSKPSTDGAHGADNITNTGNTLSTTQSIQPESIQEEKWIRII